MTNTEVRQAIRLVAIIPKDDRHVNIDHGAEQGPAKVIELAATPLRHTSMSLAGIQKLSWIPADNMPE